jgi:protoporphyrinogen oxidase
MNDIVVLGSGMAGMGATHQLALEGIRPVLYEKSSYYGGHTASFRNGAGFLFDLGPHISFTKDPRIQELFAANVDGKYEKVQIHLNNYWRGYWLTHPVQLHMHGLPEDLICEIVEDFVEQHHQPEQPINNYEQWLVASYGRKFAELFPMQYTRKYHMTPAANMSTDWLGPRMYRPSLKEMLRGALSSWSPDVHYVSNFRYPSDGGFLSYVHPFAAKADIRLGHELVAIDPRERHLRFANGVHARYDGLVSSVPLPDLIAMIAGAPADVIAASQRLACSTCVLVNVGVNRADLSKGHMTYFYAPELSPHAREQQRAARDRQHPGGGVLLEEISAADGRSRELHRARDHGPAPLRPAARGRSHYQSRRRRRSLCQRHFRSGAGRSPEDGARLSRRCRHRLLRPLR